jgi:two-component system heavy metal sensor histidine kinase CusS
MAVTTLVVVAAGGFHTYETREALLELVDRSLESWATDIAERHGRGEPPDAVPRSGRRGVRAYEVLDPSGRSHAGTNVAVDGDPELLPADERARLASGAARSVSLTRAVPRLGRLRVRAIRFTLPEPRAAAAARAVVVVTGQDLRDVDEEVRDVVAWTAATLGVALALCAVASWLAVRHFTRPLRDIAAAAAGVESGAGRVAIPGSGAGDEIDDLAGALSRAFTRLRDARDRQARFASDAAHELRTPVAAILAQAEVAARRERSSEEYRSALGAIAEAARRLHEVVEALLLVARGDSDQARIQRESVDLASRIREVVSSFAATAEERSVRLEVRGPASVPVAGDARLIGILIRNLVDNAISHGPPGTAIEVEFGTNGSGPWLSVRDHGEGIPPDALAHVFERFYRVDESRSRASGGSGLGLSIVDFIARLHGGSVHAESGVGEGTAMTVHLTPPSLGAAPARSGA